MISIDGTMWLGKSLEYFDELNSTSSYLKDNAVRLPHGAAAIAKRQTQGRGRLGRDWSQSSGDNLALSVLLHDADIKLLSALPLAVGVAVASALEGLCGITLALKWSNDVLFENRKLCGILCESRINAGKAFAVIGIGVNLSGSDEDFERLNLVYATSLKLATGKSFEVFRVASEICCKMELILENIEKNGLGCILEEYKRYCVTLGKEVRIVCDGAEQRAKALDIGEDGSLICEVGGKVISVNAGETSVRGIYGYA